MSHRDALLGWAHQRQENLIDNLGDGPAAQPQIVLRAGEFGGGAAHVHAGVMENEVLEGGEFAVEPQAGVGVGKMRPRRPSFPDRAVAEALVEAGERILCGGELSLSLSAFNCRKCHDSVWLGGYRWRNFG